MTQDEIDDLRGVCRSFLAGDDLYQLRALNERAFRAHQQRNHPAEFAACKSPLCQAAFEAEVLCDLYKEMNR